MIDLLKPSVKKNNNFGTLHLVGAMFVMLGHQFVLQGKSINIIFGLPLHGIGLRIILLISGYFIAKSVIKMPKTLHCVILFVIRRFKRIYPELIICVVMSSLIIGPLFSHLPYSEYIASMAWWRYIKMNVLLFPVFDIADVFSTNPYPLVINGSLWTLPIEMLAYVYLLIVAKISKSRRVFILYCSLPIIASVIKLAFCDDMQLIVHGTDWLNALIPMMYIFMGAIVSQCEHQFVIRQRTFFLALFASLVLASCASYMINEIICLVLISFFVFYICFQEEQGLKLKILNSEYAYGLYLWGFVVQQSLIATIIVDGRTDIHPILMFIPSFIITYLLAAISYVFVNLYLNRHCLVRACKGKP